MGVPQLGNQAIVAGEKVVGAFPTGVVVKLLECGGDEVIAGISKGFALGDEGVAEEEVFVFLGLGGDADEDVAEEVRGAGMLGLGKVLCVEPVADGIVEALRLVMEIANECGAGCGCCS